MNHQSTKRSFTSSNESKATNATTDTQPSQSFTLPRGYLQHYGLQAAPPGNAVQFRARVQRLAVLQRSQPSAAETHQIAERGISSGGSQLPHLEQIQRSFGARHDLSQVQAHIGGAAGDAAQRLGAEAYAMGNHVAFGAAPSLHTAAHEATHVIQQRAGVSLKGGVGEDEDPYEQRANAVADRVVRGESVETLLAGDAIQAGSASAVGLSAVQRLRWLARMRFQNNVGNGSEGSVSICARNTSGWIDFLTQEADTNDGCIELCAFMALAVGNTHAFGGRLMSFDWHIQNRPTTAECVNLMVAFLKTGKQIDLPDAPLEGDHGIFSGGEARSGMSDAMAAFNAKYIGPAIERMSDPERGGGLLNSDAQSNVSEYAGAALEMQRASTYQTGDNPLLDLISGALGTAIGAAGRHIAAIDNDASVNSDADFYAMKNAARIITASVAKMEADRQARVATAKTIFKTAADAAMASISPTGAVSRIIRVLCSNAVTGIKDSNFFDRLVAGEKSTALKTALDQFEVYITAQSLANEQARIRRQLVLTAFQAELGAAP